MHDNESQQELHGAAANPMPGGLARVLRESRERQKAARCFFLSSLFLELLLLLLRETGMRTSLCWSVAPAA